jgi:hypothetical protein
MPISGTMNTGPRLAFVGCEISASAGAGGGAGQAQAQGRREEYRYYACPLVP